MELPFLKKLCKKFEIKNYSKLKKQELFVRLNEYLAVKTIQKGFRRYFYKDATDAITLDPITFPCFIFKTKFGKHFFYAHDSIIKNIMKTGNTRDPMTREEYTDEDLQRLDAEAKVYYPKIYYRSCYKIKKNLNYARRIQNRENEILSYQMRMDELKEIIINFSNSNTLTWQLENEPIVVENIEYQSISSFINSVIYELKSILRNLNLYDSYTVDTFKADIQTLLSPEIYQLIFN